MAGNGMQAAATAVPEEADFDDSASLASYAESVRELEAVKRGAFTELKALVNPPVGVKEVMQALGICLGKPDLDWAKIRAQLLSNPNNLVAMCRDYDKDNMPAKTLKKLQPFISRDDFNHDAMKNKSAAVAQVAKYVLALHEYASLRQGKGTQ